MALEILIVEDEPLIARDLANILSRHHYGVAGIAFDYEEAIEIVESKSIQLALLDINLGKGHDGITLGKKLFKEFGIPIIYITSYADPDTIQRVKATQPLAYVLKPFDEKEVYATIEISAFKIQNKDELILNLATINNRIPDHLTKKEFEILQDLIKGSPYHQIAAAHFISINTINSHVKTIYGKLGVNSKIEALRFCMNL